MDVSARSDSPTKGSRKTNVRSAAPLAAGGIIQGLNVQDARVPFLQVSRGTLLFLRASTLGDLLIAAGHIIFFVNVAEVVSKFSRTRATAAYGIATADLFKTVEVKP